MINLPPAESVRVVRTPILVVVAIVVGVGSVIAAAFSILMIVVVATSPGEGFLSVPLDPSITSPIVDRWSADVHATLAGTAVVPVWVTDAPGDIAGEMAAAVVVSAGTYLLTSLIGIATAVPLLTGRLRWKFMAPTVFVAGLAFALGSFASQVLAKSAAESFSALAQSDLPTWTEPGVGVGIDLSQPVIGVVVMSTAILFGVAGRSARDADAVV